ncbi:Protein PHLOEM PROTEIN 2-LIKE A9 [Raphanus sativus]|uniref:Protein PHLOEM PROTEIN 2-LIKE A9 n=1 Tax=Raphanus sativus TaxID=3726 RepID=A0A6J0P7K4_RAPSA|nr:protein PHLOEM PROTEIN 2-LIKE A9 [Raphanus sativus]KAJ4916968.1 Protein PHLOEM PROTEIN 2-LIKE A9 [Raphanus sativus]
MSSQKRSHYKADSKMELDTNRKAWILQPSGLNFVWGGDSRYWVIPNEPGVPAELKMVSWLEVTGSFERTEPGKTYKIGFKISFKPDATGWDRAPLVMSAKIGWKGKTVWKKIKSVNQNKRGSEPVNIPDETDGRFEISVSPTADNQDTKLQFGLYEVWTGRWKTGLLIHEAFVQEV